MAIFGRRLVTLKSPLSINQCAENLALAINKESLLFADWRGKQPVIGAIHEHKFRIRKRRTYYTNSFAPFFYGTFHEDITGTLIEGYFSMHPVVKGFMIFWFAAVTYAIIGGIPGIAIVLTDLVNFVSGKGIAHSYAGLSILVFMILGGIGVILIGQLFGLSEKKYLQGFLEKTLKAHEINANDFNQ